MRGTLDRFSHAAERDCRMDTHEDVSFGTDGGWYRPGHQPQAASMASRSTGSREASAAACRRETTAAAATTFCRTASSPRNRVCRMRGWRGAAARCDRPVVAIAEVENALPLGKSLGLVVAVARDRVAAGELMDRSGG